MLQSAPGRVKQGSVAFVLKMEELGKGRAMSPGAQVCCGAVLPLPAPRRCPQPGYVRRERRLGFSPRPELEGETEALG